MRLKYKKPKITSKKVKLSYFLTPMGFLDELNLLGDVYAQTGGGGQCATISDSSGTNTGNQSGQGF